MSPADVIVRYAVERLDASHRELRLPNMKSVCSECRGGWPCVSHQVARDLAVLVGEVSP